MSPLFIRAPYFPLHPGHIHCLIVVVCFWISHSDRMRRISAKLWFAFAWRQGWWAVFNIFIGHLYFLEKSLFSSFAHVCIGLLVLWVFSVLDFFVFSDKAVLFHSCLFTPIVLFAAQKLSDLMGSHVPTLAAASWDSESSGYTDFELLPHVFSPLVAVKFQVLH